jgi:5,10-methylenetetrahydromethanopterin reductase
MLEVTDFVSSAGTYEVVLQGPTSVRDIPGGSSWLNVIEQFPERERHLQERHLHIHQGHMVEMNDADRAAWRAGGYVSLASVTLTGSADAVRNGVAAMAQAGATEIMFEPSGPDIARELDEFISAVRG